MPSQGWITAIAPICLLHAVISWTSGTNNGTTSTQILRAWSDKHNRSAPVTSLSWGCDSLLAVKFNPVEGDIVVSTATDRNIVIYDIRASTPIKKLVMQVPYNTLILLN